MALGTWSGGLGWFSFSWHCSPPETESNLLVIVLGVAGAILAVITIVVGVTLWKRNSGKALGPVRQRGAGEGRAWGAGRGCGHEPLCSGEPPRLSAKRGGC